MQDRALVNYPSFNEPISFWQGYNIPLAMIKKLLIVKIYDRIPSYNIDKYPSLLGNNYWHNKQFLEDIVGRVFKLGM